MALTFWRLTPTIWVQKTGGKSVGSYSIISTTSWTNGTSFKGEERVNKIHEIGELKFEGDQLQIVIDGKAHVFDLDKTSPRLTKAGREEREAFEISPSGYGIHWPAIDEDLSIDGLLGIKHQPETAGASVPTRRIE